jgi:cell division GTPase FtsZ
MDNIDELFVVSSTGGGTGSGTAPIMSTILQERFPETHVILVGITPVDGDAYSSHVNSLEYLQELYEVMSKPTYMLYDNDRLSGKPTWQILEDVNREIVKDIDVLRCTYNYTTKYDSIDDKDMTRLLSFPGRIIVARVEDFKEKDCDNVTIEDLIINKLKTNCHVEAQRDKAVVSTGIITNLSKTLNEEFDNNVPRVRDFVGDPIHAFNHIYVTEDRSEPNNVFFIMSGLTPINDKMSKISDRITEIDAKQKALEEESVLNSVSIDVLSNKITDEKREVKDQIDVNDLFGRFGI